MNDYFILYSNCVPVKGARRSLICDLQNGTYLAIPNNLYDILVHHSKSSISEIIELLGPENEEIVISYFDLLKANNFIYLTSDKTLLESFPPLKLDWDFPAIITNAVIDFDSLSRHDELFEDLIQQLDALHCRYIQLRFYEQIGLDKLTQLLSEVQNTGIMYVELVLPYNDEFTEDIVQELLAEKRLLKLIIFNSPEFLQIKDQGGRGVIFYVEEVISSEKDCGKFSQSYMTCNISMFTEGQKHNSCLNRKVGIDRRGNIKNCPSMHTSFGNIVDTKLEHVVKDSSFASVWKINKDSIDTCKDCEFRYLCTDCRAYLERPEDIYSKPLKCGYNPKTCTWEEWSENPLKQNAINAYGIPIKSPTI